MPTSAVGPQVYARATPRLKALVRDLMVQGTILLGLVVPYAILENQQLLGILAPAFLAAFVFYEPVLVAVRGATLGHQSMNLRVVRASDLGRVSFPRALLRTCVKAVFGIPAFIAMYFTVRHQALHDLAAGTVVIPYDSRVVRREWFDPARPEDSEVTLPGAFQRLLVILVHWGVLFVLTAIAAFALAVVVVSDCYDKPQPCSSTANVLLNILLLMATAAFIGIGVAGWRGWLWGAQRKLREQADE
jgi:uncharacterized RDD family membrane protein YckC